MVRFDGIVYPPCCPSAASQKRTVERLHERRKQVKYFAITWNSSE
jgi:hypothetical protein